ncbi:MAG: hypothetical protein JSS65_08135 [Armatimonadetes bacterium]|nr:hypothetical protein [Armatimonadota bacterium]
MRKPTAALLVTLLGIVLVGCGESAATPPQKQAGAPTGKSAAPGAGGDEKR